jgi:putative SOS response-associated peptidase YedK
MCKNVSFDTNKAFRFLIKNAASSEQMRQLHEQYSLWRENEPSRFMKKPVASDLQRFFSPGKENAALPVLLQGASGPRLAQLEWGFIPNWRSDRPKDDPLKAVDRATKALEIGRKTWNSASETMFDDEKPTWRDSAHDRRCVIVLDGYFDFYYHDEVKYPFFISPDNGDCLLVAGLWDVATINGEEHLTCAILTQQITEPTHDEEDDENTERPLRMPIILEPEDFALWWEPIEQGDYNKIDELEKLMSKSTNEHLDYITIAKNDEQRIDNNEQAHEPFEYPDFDVDLKELYRK